MIFIIVIAVVLIGCGQSANSGNGVENNTPVPVVEFQGSASDKVYELERQGFRFYYTSISLLENGIGYIDQNGNCFNTNIINREIIECDIAHLEQSGIQISIMSADRTIGMESAFIFHEMNNYIFFQHNVGMSSRSIYDNYTWSTYLKAMLFNVQNTYIVDFVESLLFYNYNEIDWGCLIGENPHFDLLELCDYEYMELGILLKNRAEHVLLEELGFESFEEMGAFLRAYFFEYVLPFMEELVDSFN